MKRFGAWLLLCLALFGVPARADERPYVVLALSGGGIKGYAHIGVLDVLERHGVGVAGIVGTSMGAAIGGMYASGYRASEMEKIVKEINLGELITTQKRPFFSVSDRMYKDASMIRPEIYTDKHGKTAGPQGIFAGVGVLDCFARHLSHVAETDFNKLSIPFAAVATDLATGEKVVIRRGSLASAIRASISLPGIFDPWELDGRLLVDGGLVSNMPVETAKELFPGYPVIAVNLTSALADRESMGSFVDVISQSITILTMQNVNREAELADLVISPGVKEYPILGDTDASVIVQQGRDATEAVLPQIKEVLKRAPRRAAVKKSEPSREEPRLVSGVKVLGVPEEMARGMERELNRSWLGRPLSVKDVIEVAADIALREDVRNVDYDFVETKRGVVVELKIQRFPAHRYFLSGHASTFSGTGWATVTAKSYDWLRPGDLLQSRFYLADNWGAAAEYYWGMDNPDNSWSLELLASRYSLEPARSRLKWNRYAATLSRRVVTGRRFMTEAGLTAGAFRQVHGAKDENYIAPYITATYNMMNVPDEQTDGAIVSFGMMWPTETEEVFLQADLTARKKLSSRMIAEVQGGFREGDLSESPLYGAYLGAKHELYSLANHPIASERFVWWRAKMSYSMADSFIGSPVAELFGGQGYAWNRNGDKIDSPWEVGVALCAPRKIFDARVYAVYSDKREWRFGLTVGSPDWDVFLPFP